MLKRIILYFAIMFGITNAAQLYMLPMESDIDRDIAILWESSLMQVLKEASFDPKKVGQDFFEGCESIDCAISKARAAGAQGLFRGRLRKAGEDSINVRLHIDWLAGNTMPQTSVQGTSPLSWDKAIASRILLKLFSGITGKSIELDREKNKSTIIKIETYPEKAVVMLNGEAICQSPCDVAAGDSLYAQIAAYWHSGENLWAERKIVKLGEDTTKIFLELKRSLAETEIRSNPEKALVFPSGVLDIKSKPLGTTPYMLRGFPGETQLRIFHKGYKDTLVNVNIDVLEEQIHFVQLSPLTDPQKVLEQNLFVKSQNKKNIGLGLLGGSIGPLITGIVLCNMAQDDYRKARDLKNELEKPSFGGPNFNAKVDENLKAIKDGDSKIAFGASLIGLSALLAGIGFSIGF